jgi:hypothetical protein
MAAKEKPVVTFSPSIRSINLYRGGRIEYRGKSGSILGATARVDSFGSKVRLRDTRQVVLRIDGPRVTIAAELPAAALGVHRHARAFAATVNEMAMELADPTPRPHAAPHAQPAPLAEPTPAPTTESTPSSPLTAELLDLLERLGKLRDSGVLTEDEFQAQKAGLLRSAEP